MFPIASIKAARYRQLRGNFLRVGGDSIPAVGSNMVKQSLKIVKNIKHGKPNIQQLGQDVGFALPDGKKLLKDVSFGIAAGQRVAVMGPSGSGKPTLACFKFDMQSFR